MNLSDALKKWNGGVMRGARKKFAEQMRVSPSIVSRWISGKEIPGEVMRIKISEVLDETISFQSRIESESQVLNKVLDRLESIEARLMQLEKKKGNRNPLGDFPHTKP